MFVFIFTMLHEKRIWHNPLIYGCLCLPNINFIQRRLTNSKFMFGMHASQFRQDPSLLDLVFPVIPFTIVVSCRRLTLVYSNVCQRAFMVTLHYFVSGHVTVTFEVVVSCRKLSGNLPILSSISNSAMLEKKLIHLSENACLFCSI